MENSRFFLREARSCVELRLILAPLLASSSRVETFRDAALYLRLCISGSTDPSSLFSVHEAGIYMEKGKYILVLCDLNIHVCTYVRFVKKKKKKRDIRELPVRVARNLARTRVYMMTGGRETDEIVVRV